jgi:hypothetical protein
MIARTWRGATKVDDADAYLQYLHETGFAEYRATPGNLEFLLLTLWESEEAIRRFAGDDINPAVFYPQDDRYLVERDDHVNHFDVVFEEGWKEP